MRSKRPPIRKRHCFLWITDPWETLEHARDSTLRLAREALAQGYESHWCDVRSIRLEGSRVLLDAAAVPEAPVSGSGSGAPVGFEARSPTEFSSVQYRVDPPVDLAYLHPLQLLALSGARIVNPAPILCTHNEKTEAAFLKGLMPVSLVSGRWDDLERFGKSHQRTVLKPLHQAQSKGVQLLSWVSLLDMEKNRELLTAVTERFSRPILLQRYLPGIAQGEQRLWFLDGKLLACARKMPIPGDFRVDIDRGSVLRKTALTAAERKAAKVIGRFLSAQKIRLAAVDLIDGFVTDFNFTSPGLIMQMEEILGKNLAQPIIRALARGR